MIKELVNNHWRPKVIIFTAFSIKAISSVSALLVLIVSGFCFEPSQTLRYYIFIVGLSYLLYPFQVIEYYFQANVKSKYIVISQQGATAVVSGLKVIGIINKFTIEYFVWVQLIELVVLTIVQIIIYQKMVRLEGQYKFDKKLAVSMLKESLPIIFTSIFIIIYMKIDQIMIQKMLDESALGIFSASAKLSEAFCVLPGLIATALFPAIINGLKVSKEEYFNRMQRLYAIFTLITTFTSLAIFFLGEKIISVLYGPDFIPASTVLKIHFANSVFLFLGIAYSQAFIVERIQHFTTINTIIGAGLNIILNLYLIPKMGVLGSAFATLASQFYSGFICLAFFKATRKHFYLMINSFNIFNTLYNYYRKLKLH